MNGIVTGWMTNSLGEVIGIHSRALENLMSNRIRAKTDALDFIIMISLNCFISYLETKILGNFDLSNTCGRFFTSLMNQFVCEVMIAGSSFIWQYSHLLWQVNIKIKSVWKPLSRQTNNDIHVNKFISEQNLSSYHIYFLCICLFVVLLFLFLYCWTKLTSTDNNQSEKIKKK